jgi:hypothetical protein
MYRNKQNSIGIVAVQPNVILGRQYLLSPQMELFIFIFWENMAYCIKKYPFSPAFKLGFKKIFVKRKQASHFLWRQPLIGGW